MSKIDKHIEIVRSSKTWLSSMSQDSGDAILSTLRSKYSRVGITIVDDISGLNALVKLNPDLVFLGMKFINSDTATNTELSKKIWISEYLDKFGITYTGSNKIAHERSVEKSLAKKCMLSAGVDTSPYFVIKKSDLNSEIKIPKDFVFPLFVKPNNRGGGLGINDKSVVNNLVELKAKVYDISHNLGSDSIIERYLTGREFSVAVFNQTDQDSIFAMPLELVTSPDEFGYRILGSGVKSANKEHVLSVDNIALRLSICDLALNAFIALGGRDFGRIDIRIDRKGDPQFLEANLIPSLIEGYGSFPKACYLNERIGFKSMIFKIVELAFLRDLNNKVLAV
jgi:D-alanine-D-alanine ligase